MQKSSLFKRLTIFVLYNLYCFDIAAIVIVFIIFTPLIIPTSSQLIPSNTSLASRNVILGLLFAAYPITQFFGAPILGELSDLYGRKLILVISSLLTACSFFLTAVSILSLHLPLLFLSRLIGGFFAGNASLAQAAVSDIVPSSKKSSYMALFAVVGGFSWLVGPFVGSIFSNPKIVSWFNYDVPFWLLGLIFLFSWGLLLLTMDADKPSKKSQKLSVSQFFKNFASIFKLRIVALAFTASGVAMLGWMILNSFTAPYLTEKYHYSEHALSLVYAYYSIFWIIGGGCALYWFKKHPCAKLNLFCLLFIPFFILLFVFWNKPYAVFWITPIPIFLMSISVASFMSLFSHLVDQKMQGKIFGGYTGMLALASAIAPSFSGWIAKYGLHIPFAASSLILFVTFILYFVWYMQQKKELSSRNI
ncbi:MAG: Tetracycline resistance protein, class C [Chlamydiae bacterium]|nr:Tetracycline resistance protein, class C [Chlamydiota bacterium]